MNEGVVFIGLRRDQGGLVCRIHGDLPDFCARVTEKPKFFQIPRVCGRRSGRFVGVAAHRATLAGGVRPAA